MEGEGGGGLSPCNENIYSRCKVKRGKKAKD